MPCIILLQTCCVPTSRWNIHGNRVQGVKPDDVHLIGRITWKPEQETLTIGLRDVRLVNLTRCIGKEGWPAFLSYTP